MNGLLANFKDKGKAYLFILPAVAMLGLFYIYPFFKIFQLSLFEWDGISKTMSFVGFAQFHDIIFNNKIWWQSMWHATYITLLALILQNGLALMLALFVDRGIKYGNVYRVIFFLPPVLSGIVVGLVWNWIFNGNYGLLNYWLTKIGLGHLATTWLSNPKTALTCVAVIHMWKGFGWGFIILLAGLQNIPRTLYEAARIDGASGWDVFKRITVPLMIPVFVLVMVLTVLGTMQIYDIIVSTTGGGPGYHTEVPVSRILARMLGNSQFGYACAMGIVFGVVLILLSIIQMNISKHMKQT
ncbi:MAG: sugar ABC transporter permease [Candidatus Omnitrophica bacterium]|nr:sugar ABC transporter permease [Candidatus Omnitrophota bacterium]